MIAQGGGAILDWIMKHEWIMIRLEREEQTYEKVRTSIIKMAVADCRKAGTESAACCCAAWYDDLGSGYAGRLYSYNLFPAAVHTRYAEMVC